MIFAHGGKDTQKPWEGGCPGGCAAHPELQVARTPFRLKEARRGASHCAADHRATKCARDEHVQHTRLCQEALKAIRRLRLASRLMPWRWATLSLALADCHVDVDPAEIFGWKGGGIDRLRFFKARAPMTHIEVYDPGPPYVRFFLSIRFWALFPSIRPNTVSKPYTGKLFLHISAWPYLAHIWPVFQYTVLGIFQYVFQKHLASF